MPRDTITARALAAAFLAGAFEVDELVSRAGRLLGRRPRCLRPLARRVCDAFAGRPLPLQAELTRFILSDRRFWRAFEPQELCLSHSLVGLPAMRPVAPAASWTVPAICSPGALAEWLGLTIGQLEWFADVRTLEYKRNTGRLRHYTYRVLAKRFGQVRLVEAPKPRLKEIQRRILAEILDHVPLHDAAHGFRRGRSIKTFAAPHVGRQVVLRIDLQDFFPLIRAARVRAVFRAIGYPERVAALLAGLCTNASPLDVWEDQSLEWLGSQVRDARWRYAQPHLPQGAPTSPALANLCSYRLDCRLTGLARSAHAVYTRYADDLAFSGDGDFARAVKRFGRHVCATVLEEGFTPHFHKTRVMKAGVRQRLAGLVINQRLNIARADYDRLKAILTNCVRLGPESQNRAGHDAFGSHLDGRISFVEMVNPERGRRLRELFDAVRW
jgi:hypothetical protein